MTNTSFTDFADFGDDFDTTPPRTPKISGLKSQVLKPTFLS